MYRGNKYQKSCTARYFLFKTSVLLSKERIYPWNYPEMILKNKEGIHLKKHPLYF